MRRRSRGRSISIESLRWGYARERGQIESAETLSRDEPVREQITPLASALAGAEAIDRQQIEAVYVARCRALRVPPDLRPTLTTEERAAAQLVPRQVANSRATAGGAPQPAPGAGPPALGGYHAMEARAFADGSRSVLDIRNAISAEFGPLALERVVMFFQDLQASGDWTVERLASPAPDAPKPVNKRPR